MKVSSILFLALLSRANATGSSFLRGEAADEVSLGQLACIIKGGSSQKTCGATKSEDGSQCVWFEFATHGACFSEAIASQMERAVPSIGCGDTVGCNDDDDQGPATDDMVTADDNPPVVIGCGDSVGCEDDDDSGPATDDMVTADDDAGDDDAEFDDIVADDDAAADDDSADDDAAPAKDDDAVPDDYWKCLENYATSKACTDAGCAWCDNKGGFGVCMDKDQAATFDDSAWYSCTMPSLSGSASSHPLHWKDPSDSSCLVATIGGDGASCKATVDSEGKACDWCSFQGYDICLNGDQAQLAESFGASCDDRVNDEATVAKDLIDDLADPNDPSCLLETLSGSADSCKAAKDADGKSCDWCSFQGYDFCLNGDQAQIAEQYGASCDDDRTDTIDDLADPNDPSCLLATLNGSADSCKASKDADGKSCDWCSLQGYDFCLNDDQAQLAEQFGATCDNADGIIEVATDTLSDPSDPSCLLITINGDESACRGSTDVDGKACEWCSYMTHEFCANADQAELLEPYGATCNEEAIVDHPNEDLSDPRDTQCLAATVNGNDYCQGATDSDGKPCQWCSFESYEFCLDVDQAQIVEQFGADCGDDSDSKANNISKSVA